MTPMRDFSNRDSYQPGEIVRYWGNYWKATRPVTPPWFPSLMSGDVPGESGAWVQASATEITGHGGGGGGHGGGGHGGHGGHGHGHGWGPGGWWGGPWGWGGYDFVENCDEYDAAGNCVIFSGEDRSNLAVATPAGYRYLDEDMTVFGADSPVGQYLRRKARGR